LDTLATARPFTPPRFSAAQFLIALVLLLCLSPLFNELAQGSLIEALLMTLVLVSAVPAVGGRRRTLLLAGLLAVPAVAGSGCTIYGLTSSPARCFWQPRSCLQSSSLRTTWVSSCGRSKWTARCCARACRRF
jgi:hypothetical protein